MMNVITRRLKSPMRCATHGTEGCACTGTTEPWISRLVFGDLRLAPFWLLLRLWLGWQWLESGWGKLTNPAWMDGGAALRAFWERAIMVPETGRAPVAYGWYRDFLQEMLEGGHYTWFAKLVAIGEFAVGIALVLGLLTGIAAFFGVFMNWHFVMAGAASTNAMLALVGVLLVLAWRTAGWWGLDRWVLPLLGLRRRPTPSAGAQIETPRPTEAGRGTPRPSGGETPRPG